jgi:hypothetical protein
VRSDGTYTHQYRSATHGPVTQTGSWELERIGGDTHLTFYDFVDASPDRPEARKGHKGIWPSSIERRGGKIRIWVNRDVGHFYTRQTLHKG